MIFVLIQICCVVWLVAKQTYVSDEVTHELPEGCFLEHCHQRKTVELFFVWLKCGPTYGQRPYRGTPLCIHLLPNLTNRERGLDLIISIHLDHDNQFPARAQDTVRTVWDSNSSYRVHSPIAYPLDHRGTPTPWSDPKYVSPRLLGRYPKGKKAKRYLTTSFSDRGDLPPWILPTAVMSW